jgi:hypothetical protein
MPFTKGNPGGPGRPKGRLDPIEKFNLKMAARQLCPEGLEVVAAALKHKDVRIRLMAAEIAFERGYGKPEQKTDVTATHRFAIVPQTMPKDEWLANRGQPLALPPPDPDRKLN